MPVPTPSPAPHPLPGAEAAPLAAILAALPVGVTVRASSGAILYANDAARAGAHAGIETRTSELRVGGAVYGLSLAIDMSEQRELEEDLFRRAFFDAMTGLPNRALMERSIETMLLASAPAPFALAFIDLDNFKHINDYYGHAVGDGLLVKVAARIADAIRPSDMLARVGGDEFVLLLAPVGDAEALGRDVEHLSARLKEPFFIEGHEVFSSASIGVSVYPRDGVTYETLRINADTAMYRVKGATKGGVRFFDPNIGHAATERMKVEQRLRLAIRDRRLCCAYQPKVDFRSDRVVGLEVLLRWRDEEGVIHAPGDFVNLAVELGLMDEVTLLVLAETLGAIDRIDAAFGPQSRISVNVAARQADDPAFMNTFARALADTGCPKRFMVELTEEAFFQKNRFQTHILPMLRDVGAGVSIDDFGVGYSSLAALADITADELKVDRSFITDIHKRPRSQSVLKTIESLGNALGMSVVVEGVETFEELAYLQAATRIRCAQGYYFSRAIFLDDLGAARGTLADTRLPAIARDAAVHRPAQARSLAPKVARAE